VRADDAKRFYEKMWPSATTEESTAEDLAAGASGQQPSDGGGTLEGPRCPACHSRLGGENDHEPGGNRCLRAQRQLDEALVRQMVEEEGLDELRPLLESPDWSEGIIWLQGLPVQDMIEGISGCVVARLAPNHGHELLPRIYEQMTEDAARLQRWLEAADHSSHPTVDDFAQLPGRH
jgi:hypothetical protein